MRVHAKRGEARLEEPRELTSLSLVVEGDERSAVGDWGTWVDDEHVVVPAERLVEWAGPVADEPGWREDFEKMIAYATSQGWVDDHGGVRMHVS